MRGFWVEGRCGFVGKQEGGVAGECAGDADALFLAAGKLFGVVIAAIREAHEVEKFGHSFVSLVFGDARELEWVVDVAGGGARIHEVELLEDHADIAAHSSEFFFLHAHDIGAVEKHFAAGGRVEAVNHAHKCGLAGAGVANDANDFTRCHGEIDITERNNVLSTFFA